MSLKSAAVSPGLGDMFSRYAACISEYPQADCPIFASVIMAYMDCRSAFMRRPSTGLRLCVYGGDRTNSHWLCTQNSRHCAVGLEGSPPLDHSTSQSPAYVSADVRRRPVHQVLCHVLELCDRSRYTRRYPVITSINTAVHVLPAMSSTGNALVKSTLQHAPAACAFDLIGIRSLVEALDALEAMHDGQSDNSRPCSLCVHLGNPTATRSHNLSRAPVGWPSRACREEASFLWRP